METILLLLCVILIIIIALQKLKIKDLYLQKDNDESILLETKQTANYWYDKYITLLNQK